MRIKVQENGGKAINLIFPTGLLFNPITAKIAFVAIEKALKQKEEFRISEKQLRQLFFALRDCKRNFPGLVLVDVESADGDLVKITL